MSNTGIWLTLCFGLYGLNQQLAVVTAPVMSEKCLSRKLCLMAHHKYTTDNFKETWRKPLASEVSLFLTKRMSLSETINKKFLLMEKVNLRIFVKEIKLKIVRM